jgi:hypothetical protein
LHVGERLSTWVWSRVAAPDFLPPHGSI